MATPPGLRTPPAPPPPHRIGGAAARWGRRTALAGVLASTAILAVAVGGYRIASDLLGPPQLEIADQLSTVVLDRDDKLLFQVRADLQVDASTRLSPGLPVEVRLP